MSFATLFNEPQTPQSWAEWSFSNRADHDEIIGLIQQKHGIRIDKWIIEPITPLNLQNFLLGHQAMHDAEAAALGVDGQNFLGDIREWWWDHAEQHRRERVALGI
jgi:hypothetical protein